MITTSLDEYGDEVVVAVCRACGDSFECVDSFGVGRLKAHCEKVLAEPAVRFSSVQGWRWRKRQAQIKSVADHSELLRELIIREVMES